MTRYEYDYKKLEERIAKRYGNKARFCKETGVSKSLLSKKLSNTTGFTQKDITMFVNWLRIPVTQIGDYFFTTKV